LRKEKERPILLITDQIIIIIIEDKVIIITITTEVKASEVTIIHLIAIIVDRPDIWLGIVL
jgi:hypothetical protein